MCCSCYYMLTNYIQIRGLKIFSFGSWTCIMSDITHQSFSSEVSQTEVISNNVPMYSHIYLFIYFCMVYLVTLSVTQTILCQLTGLSLNNEFNVCVQKQSPLI
jgi:hypothetical protein